MPAGEKLSEDSAQLDPFPRRGTDAQTVALVGGGVASVRRRLLARLRPVPRAPPVRRARRRPVDRVAGRPRAGHRSPPPRRRLHGAARRRPRRPDALQRRPGSRRPRGGQRPRVRRARRLEPAARRPARRALAERADRARRPAADRRGRRRRHPRAAHPRRAGDRGAAPAACSSSTRCTAPTCGARGSPTSSTAPRATTRCARASSPARARAASCATSRTASAAGRARSLRPRRARGAPTRGSAWRPRRPTTCSTRWTGGGGTTAFDGSSRFEGLGRNRASSAFDGDPRRAWIAGWIRSRGAWLQWRTRAPRTIRTLRLERAPVRVRFPTRVRVVADGRPTAPLAVAADGSDRPAGAAARAHGAHRGPRRRLPARHARHRHASAERSASGR